MKKVFFAFGMFCSSVLLAQRIDVVGYNSQPTGFVEAYGFLGGGSDQVSLSFANKALFSDSISPEEVAAQYDKITQSQLRAGYDYQAAIRAKIPLSESVQLLAKVADYSHAGVLIDKDLFGLYMKGNEPFKGDTLFFSRSELNVINYQTFGLGAAFQVSDETSLSVLVSGVRATSWMNYNLARGSYYTSDFGDTLEASGLFSGYQTPMMANNFMASNGGGISLDLGLSSTVDLGYSKLDINISVEQLGLIQWKPGITQYGIDTTLAFYGFEINDLNGNIGQAVDQQWQDSLQMNLTDFTSKSTVNMGMPARLFAELQSQTDEGLEFGAGFVYRSVASFNSYYWLNAGYQFENGVSAKLEGGYGGYAKLQMGALFTYESDEFGFTARLSNIESLVTPKQRAGLTAFLGLKYKFEL